MVIVFNSNDMEEEIKYFDIENMLIKFVIVFMLLEVILCSVGVNKVVKIRLKSVNDNIVFVYIFGGLYLFLVEDNEMNQELVCELFDVVGVKIMVVENGEVVFMLLEKYNVDGVLMDC